MMQASMQTNMSSNPIISYRVSDAPDVLKKWCDRWYTKAKAAGVRNTKLFAKAVNRPNGLPTNYHLSLLVIGSAPKVKSFGRMRLEEITEDVLREATADLMKQVGIVQVFDY